MPAAQSEQHGRQDWQDVDVEDKPGRDCADVKEQWLSKPDFSHWKAMASPHRPTKRYLKAMKSVLWPFSPLSSPASKKAPATLLRKTAWLDGLRGFAALLVYVHHHELWAHDAFSQNGIFENSFGYEGRYHFAALPGVRNFFTGGHLAVSTFFVISGYVLSAKPLSLIQADEHGRLAENIASALFRRWLRLYIPLFATTFLYMSSWHWPGWWVDGADKAGSWGAEVWKWYCEVKNFSFVFNAGGEPWLSYNFHLWSIPVEFKGSLVVYTSMLAFSRCSRRARLWCELGLVVYFMYVADGWYCALFSSGVLLSDLDLLAEKGELPRLLRLLAPAKTFIHAHLFLLAMFLGGVPSQNADVGQLRRNRGWHYLSFLKPQAVFDYKWFYLFWAATLLVASIPRLPPLRRFFLSRFCQYLGRVSFALYLAHGPVLWVLGDRLYTAAGWTGPGSRAAQAANLPGWVNRFPLSTGGPFGLEPALLLPQVVLLPVTLALAELVTRWFDEPAVRFAQWLYRRTLAPAKPVLPQSRQGSLAERIVGGNGNEKQP